MTPVDYLVIGHITRDLLPGGACASGGTASYAALTALALARTPGIVTSVGPEADLSIFDGRVALACRASPETTTFENLYVEGRREQRVYAVAAGLSPEHVPPAWADDCPIVHVGPVMGECAPELVAHFAGRAFVGVTPQGWLRGRDARGRVVPRPWREAQALLTMASATVLSVEDVGHDRGLIRRYADLARVLLVTDGWRGGTLFLDGVPAPFPAYPETEVDPTGAGDIFATVFFVSVASGVEPRQAAHLAACVAARSVARRGLTAVPLPDEVAACRAALSIG